MTETEPTKQVVVLTVPKCDWCFNGIVMVRMIWVRDRLRTSDKPELMRMCQPCRKDKKAPIWWLPNPETVLPKIFTRYKAIIRERSLG